MQNMSRAHFLCVWVKWYGIDQQWRDMCPNICTAHFKTELKRFITFRQFEFWLQFQSEFFLFSLFLLKISLLVSFLFAPLSLSLTQIYCAHCQRHLPRGQICQLWSHFLTLIGPFFIFPYFFHATGATQILNRNERMKREIKFDKFYLR